jgi:hypothetical protein
MARKSKYNSVAALLSAILLTCSLLPQAMGQPTQTQQQASNISSQPKPISLEHLYGHFLIHLNDLNAKAASEEAQGRDGKWLRNHHQASLGFSDTDFAVIRASSVRLTAELKDLNAQAATIKAAGLSATSSAQLNALTAQREAAINTEISYLKDALPPDKIAAFESYITQFFSPNNFAQQTSSTGAQAAPAAVQQ